MIPPFLGFRRVSTSASGGGEGEAGGKDCHGPAVQERRAGRGGLGFVWAGVRTAWRGSGFDGNMAVTFLEAGTLADGRWI